MSFLSAARAFRRVSRRSYVYLFDAGPNSSPASAPIVQHDDGDVLHRAPLERAGHRLHRLRRNSFRQVWARIRSALRRRRDVTRIYVRLRCMTNRDRVLLRAHLVQLRAQHLCIPREASVAQSSPIIFFALAILPQANLAVAPHSRQTHFTVKERSPVNRRFSSAAETSWSKAHALRNSTVSSARHPYRKYRRCDRPVCGRGHRPRADRAGRMIVSLILTPSMIFTMMLFRRGSAVITRDVRDDVAPDSEKPSIRILDQVERVFVM